MRNTEAKPEGSEMARKVAEKTRDKQDRVKYHRNHLSAVSSFILASKVTVQIM